MSKLVVNIDASSLGSLHCFRRYWNKYILGIRPDAVPHNDTELGSAWHIFRNVLAKERDDAKAIATAAMYFKTRRDQGMIFKPKKEYLNEEYLMQLCMKYIRKFGKEKSFGKYEYLCSPVDGTPLVEQSFSIKLFENDACIIYMQGTMDEYTIHHAGYLVLGDDKTSSQWDIKKHLRSFEMKPQLRFYRLAFQMLSEQPDGEWFKEILATRRLGCRINGVFLKPDVNDVEFEHSEPYFFRDDELLTQRMQLNNLVQHIANGITHSLNTVPAPEGLFNETCNGAYGTPCEFLGACRMTEDVYRRMLDLIPRKEYEPLNFRKL